MVFRLGRESIAKSAAGTGRDRRSASYGCSQGLPFDSHPATRTFAAPTERIRGPPRLQTGDSWSRCLTLCSSLRPQPPMAPQRHQPRQVSRDGSSRNTFRHSNRGNRQCLRRMYQCDCSELGREEEGTCCHPPPRALGDDLGEGEARVSVRSFLYSGSCDMVSLSGVCYRSS
jgi:hypothetical protein